MDKKRFEHIDFLRAIGIVGVIVIHTLSRNLVNQTNYFFWNWLHFVEVAFVFCSGYVLTALYKDKLTSLSMTFSWYKKRLLNLLVPYWIYLAVHYLLMFFFPGFFSGLGLKLSSEFIIKSVTLVEGIDLSWLPLLFMQLTLLFPILLFLSNKRKLLIAFILLIVGFITFFTLFTFPRSDYRWVMWIGWSLVLMLSMYISKKDDSKKLGLISLMSLIGFIGLSLILSDFHKSLQLTDNKYPPNFYFLAYGMIFTPLLIIMSKIPLVGRLKSFYKFLSVNSYALYFIHYIVLDLNVKVMKPLVFGGNVLLQFGFVLIGSLLVSKLLQFNRK